MAIRELMQNKKQFSAGGAVLLIAAAIASIVYQVNGSGTDTRKIIPRSFFTVDEGKTWFAAPDENVAPFDYQGKVANKANVFRCGGKDFVGYIERYTPEARDALLSKGGKVPKKMGGPPVAHPKDEPDTPETRARASYNTIFGASVNGRELKRPGDKEWVRSFEFAKVQALQTIKCPDGAEAEAVGP